MNTQTQGLTGAAIRTNNQLPIKIKYVLYARKSTESEEKQVLSIDSQIKEMLQIAERESLEIVDIRRESHSAKDSGQRPVFNEIVKDLRGGRYSGILTWAPDRLSRNAGDLGSLVDLMDQKVLLEIKTYGQKFTEDIITFYVFGIVKSTKWQEKKATSRIPYVKIREYMKYPNLNEEKKLWRKGYKLIVGLDEAGRGPLAGPVTAAAITVRNFQFSISNFQSIFNDPIFKKIKDSKKLSLKAREKFYKILTNHPQIKWGTGIVSEKVIDKINIKNAAELAMWRAVKKIKKFPDFLIIDGNHINSKKLKDISYKLITKADEKVFSCAAASILAKVTRDRIMDKYDKKYPKYGFRKHKGYPTKLHKKMLKKIGPCPIHRKSFSWG